MDVLVLADIPIGFALVAAAHAWLAAYLRFASHPDTQTWLEGPFKKVICKVDAAGFEAAKRVDDHVVITESALGGREVALAFRPRADWPKALRFLPKYA